MRSPKYVVIEKHVGETPLIAIERMRKEVCLDANVPIAYAGRLDPMASGKLLVLIGDECKNQKKYHALDKEYEVEILLGVSSDTGDVLGVVTQGAQKLVTETGINVVLKKFTGIITLPYPHFSSKTVAGKQLHTWTLEKRLDEIEIPVKKSSVYKLTLTALRTISKSEMLKVVREKIETIPKVIDPKKALGADFRRVDVRKSWNEIEKDKDGDTTYHILSFMCICSSGTYMRTLSAEIAKALGTCGLAYSIHRTKIGTYLPIVGDLGFWTQKF